MNIFYYKTAIGNLCVEAEGEYITHILFDGQAAPKDAEVKETAVIKETGRQLAEYFAGKRKTFDVPLAPKGTPYQQKVWQALIDVKYGETATYKQIAERTGNAKASRAVGMCNNKNPIPIIVPCHRIIGTSGKLVGYAGGLDVKQKLLELEGVK